MASILEDIRARLEARSRAVSWTSGRYMRSSQLVITTKATESVMSTLNLVLNTSRVSNILVDKEYCTRNQIKQKTLHLRPLIPPCCHEVV